MLGTSGPLTGSCTEPLPPVGWGSSPPLHVCTHLPHLLQVYTCHFLLRGPCKVLIPPRYTHPHLSQKVCRQGRTLGHRYRSRQMLHTRNCLSIGWTSGPGLSSLFAMVPTDGTYHSHQPVYGKTVSTREASKPSPHLIPCRALAPSLLCQGPSRVKNMD